ncbi:Esa1p-associated factor [Tieghemiomyces parasiticus]|uniref:Chromatin modification-related protein EAF3 n=1 Tax=Tieghemiomyces parasiticus TaxID=78921 RepID=A0A9W8DHA3_9FUNG|nr:Esa1p-associated factor [Tieghemiomyces parasiticus]
MGNDHAPLTFKDNEKVLCFHGPMLYEAKVLKADYWTGEDSDEDEEGPHYLVHYKGWKQTWDEWVPEPRVLKYDAENLDRQKRLKVMHTTKKKTSTAAAGSGIARGEKISGSGSQSSTANVSPSDRSRKRPRESGGGGGGGGGGSGAAEGKSGPTHPIDDDAASSVGGSGGWSGDHPRRAEVRIPIPNALKSQLVDDWERITKDHQLVPLPRSPTVAEVFQRYQRSKAYDYTDGNSEGHAADSATSSAAASSVPPPPKRRNGRQDRYTEDVLDEIVEGLQLYFNTALGNLLLYRFERLQYADICKKYPGRPMVDIYGAEHLLRLFETLTTLKEHLTDFLRFLQAHADEFFASEYENASPAYISLARS